MIIKVNKANFIPHTKRVRFGYDDITYGELFDTKTHLFHFYPTKNKNEYLVCLDEINRDKKVGTVHVLDVKRPGTKDLIKRALKNDYHFDESEYIVTFE